VRQLGAGLRAQTVRLQHLTAIDPRPQSPEKRQATPQRPFACSPEFFDVS
jgi:hypothetical protein